MPCFIEDSSCKDWRWQAEVHRWAMAGDARFTAGIAAKDGKLFAAGGW